MIASMGIMIGALAAIPDASGVIHGCYAPNNGYKLRVIDTAKTAKCPSGQVALNWNQKGVPGSPGPQGLPGSPGLQGIQGSPGPNGAPGVIADVEVASSNVEGGIHAATWTDIAGATVTVTVPPDTTGLVLVRFSATAACAVGQQSASCFVRVRIDGVATALPDYAMFTRDGPSYALGGGGTVDSAITSQVIERSLGGLTPGEHVVTVQVKTGSFEGADEHLRWVGWNLVAELATE